MPGPATRATAAPAPDSPRPLSWRDPAGRLFRFEGRLVRVVEASGAAPLRAALSSTVLMRKKERGRLVAATPITDEWERRRVGKALGCTTDSASPLLLEHPRVFFPSYPYEWAPEMLLAAGQLTLELARDLADEGLGIKDASAYNVLFEGTRPVFVDWLSFEIRSPGDFRWMPFAQFARHFLNPLLLNRTRGLPLADIFVKRRDGMDAIEAYRYYGWLHRLSPRVFSLVTLPAWLSRRAHASNRKLYTPRPVEPERARYVLKSLLRGLDRQLRRNRPAPGRSSFWSGYMDEGDFIYDRAQVDFKERFVRDALEKAGPGNVLDVGANTGHFSAIAAGMGNNVVAIDFDEVSVGRIYRMAEQRSLNVLPLVVDFSRPSPATGWRNSECDSFLDRARGNFDVVMMLAVIHHLVASERVPMSEVARVAHEITRDHLLVEYVDPEDRQFQKIARGRDYSHVTTDAFERTFGDYFTIERKAEIPGSSRRLDHLRRTPR